ncbi:MAG: tRNA (adenosine(37)-N6)-threonylcarbamoyltransferase complex transferase subunit TsaD [Rickettsiales bacterium]|nr:tRNA (adenosine(37)-N6)-threonylcarbamoyltransferase complex transferase subunit TsaD [Rickettsiales bacterium]
MKILGIETSCDETSVAIVDENRQILANIVRSQLKEHDEYAGVVPEIAARAHLDFLSLMVPEALAQAGLDYKDLDGIAVTSGPGLIGGVLVGVMAAKSIALAHNLPILGINHLEGHLLTPRLIDADLEFPYLVVLVSGGHSQILIAHGLGNYERLATTVDDAVGEAFDKSAKLMGLGYPGGPKIEKMALEATGKYEFDLPRPVLKNHKLNLSFSGLKTAVRREAEKYIIDGKIEAEFVSDLSNALQEAIGDVLNNRLKKALKIYLDQTNPENPVCVLCGGVAANKVLRARLEATCQKNGTKFVAPPLSLCGDQAAMIAWAGLERFKAGYSDDLDFVSRPRWPLDKEAEPVLGEKGSKSGVKA